MDLGSLIYPQFNDYSQIPVKYTNNHDYGPNHPGKLRYLPKKPLSNPLYLSQLGSQINYLKNPRYVQNPATLENNKSRLENLRIRYDLGEKEDQVENPYSRQAVVQHQLNKGDGD